MPHETQSLAAGQAANPDAILGSNGWSLLELWVPIRAALPLLVLAPLAAGAIAFATAAFVLPRTYVSSAVLSLDDKAARKAEAMMRSAALLDAVIAKNPELPGGSIDQKRQKLADNVRVDPSRSQNRANATIFFLNVRDTSATRAQTIAKSLFEGWLILDEPRGPEIELLKSTVTRLTQEISTVAGDLNKYETTFFAAQSAAVGADRDAQWAATRKIEGLAALLVNLRGERLKLAEQLETAQTKLVRNVGPQSVLSAPNVPVEPDGQGKAIIALLTALGVLAALLGFVVLRFEVLRSMADPATARRMQRARNIVNGAAKASF